MMKRALFAVLAAGVLGSASGCHGLLGALLCCDDHLCDGCYDEGCIYGDGGGCHYGPGGCGPLDLLGFGFTHRHFAHHCLGCGPRYWGEFSDRPDFHDPCDGCGNWTGHGGCGGGGCCGSGAGYDPLHAHRWHGYGDPFYDGAVSDMHWSEGRPVEQGPPGAGRPTPAPPRPSEDLPPPDAGTHRDRLPPGAVRPVSHHQPGSHYRR